MIFYKFCAHKKHINAHRIPSKASYPYACTHGDCDKSFASSTRLLYHTSLHKNKMFDCFFCPWKGAQPSICIEHLNHHLGMRPFKCAFCQSTFYNKVARNTHVEAFHERIVDRYRCKICDFITHSRAIMAQHKSTHK